MDRLRIKARFLALREDKVKNSEESRQARERLLYRSGRERRLAGGAALQ